MIVGAIFALLVLVVGSYCFAVFAGPFLAIVTGTQDLWSSSTVGTTAMNALQTVWWSIPLLLLVIVCAYLLTSYLKEERGGGAETSRY